MEVGERKKGVWTEGWREVGREGGRVEGGRVEAEEEEGGREGEEEGGAESVTFHSQEKLTNNSCNTQPLFAFPLSIHNANSLISLTRATCKWLTAEVE